jgi:hypothetical protein
MFNDDEAATATVFDMTLQTWFAASMTFWLVVVGVFIFHILGRLSVLESKGPVVHFVAPSQAYPPKPARIPQRVAGAPAASDEDDLHLYDEAVDVPVGEGGEGAAEEQKKMN